MSTYVIPAKDFRQNISSLIKKALKNNTSYIVTKRGKPVIEVRPCYNEKVEIDDTQHMHYQHLDAHLEFWKDPCDDDIFKY